MARRLWCEWCDEPITDPDEHACCRELFGEDPDDDEHRPGSVAAGASLLTIMKVEPMTLRRCLIGPAAHRRRCGVMAAPPPPNRKDAT